VISESFDFVSIGAWQQDGILVPFVKSVAGGFKSVKGRLIRMQQSARVAVAAVGLGIGVAAAVVMPAFSGTYLLSGEHRAVPMVEPGSEQYIRELVQVLSHLPRLPDDNGGLSIEPFV